MNFGDQNENNLCFARNVTLASTNSISWTAKVTKIHWNGHLAQIFYQCAGIIGECGGSLLCATCHCYVQSDNFDQLNALSNTEKKLLKSVVDPRKNSRLACRVEITNLLQDATIKMPSSQY